MTVIGICSARPTPSVQGGSKFGHQYWKKDVWHIQADNKKTLCGRDASNYLTIGPVEPDQHLCDRCRKKM